MYDEYNLQNKNLRFLLPLPPPLPAPGRSCLPRGMEAAARRMHEREGEGGGGIGDGWGGRIGDGWEGGVRRGFS